ncbi:hypothetical protein JCM10207_000810 [Rhodosporidiobolus poonsookiae]
MASPPPSPPSRPVPPPPSSTEQQAPPDPSTQLLGAPLDLESEIDSSTLSYLSSSLRNPWLPWLFRLVVFTSGAYIVRFLLPYCLTAIRWSISRLWRLIELALRLTLWMAVYGGALATALWVLAGVGMLVAYGGLRAKPRWKRFARESPVVASAVKKAAGWGGAWRLARRWIGGWAGKAVLACALALEGYAFLRRSPIVAVPSPSRPSSSAAADPLSDSTPGAMPGATSTFDADAIDDEELERLARKVREGMLRDSLLSAGRRGASERTASQARTKVEEEQAGDAESEEGAAVGEQQGRGETVS